VRERENDVNEPRSRECTLFGRKMTKLKYI
jgi:hypothetical protein